MRNKILLALYVSVAFFTLQVPIAAAYSVQATCETTGIVQGTMMGNISFTKASNGNVRISENWHMLLRHNFYPSGQSPFESLAELEVEEEKLIGNKPNMFRASAEIGDYYIVLEWWKDAPYSPNGSADLFFGKLFQMEDQYFTFEYCEGNVFP